MNKALLPLALALCLLTAGMVTRPAWAATVDRIALIIGNADYKSAPLKNPVNDARAVARALKEVGFEVDLKENLSQQGFIAALRNFGNRLKETGATGLFYYAGHGMQVKGANYLIPVDAGIESEDEIRYMAMDANQVLDKMEQAGNRLNIVILDACRDNPFARSFRSKQNGLAQMDAPSGMLIAFATSPGAVAYDGDGVNGVYTKHLLRNLTIPGLPVELVLKRVREGVSKDTGSKQIPWESSSLLGDFYFREGAAQTTAAVGQIDAGAMELAFWESVRNSESAGEFRAYLEKYPNGQFAALARARMDTLLAQAAAPGQRVRPSSTTQVAAAEPTTLPAARARNFVQVGDAWTYNVLQNGKRKVDELTVTVIKVDQDSLEEEIRMAGFKEFSATRSFKSGFDPRAKIQETKLPLGIFLVEFSPYVPIAGVPGAGRTWAAVPALLAIGYHSTRTKMTLAVAAVAEEKIVVPAGEFHTVRVEARSPAVSETGAGSNSLVFTYWYTPQSRRVVKIMRRQASTFSLLNTVDVLELAKHTPASN